VEPVLIIAIFAPFLLVPILWISGKHLRARTGWLALLAPLLSSGLLISLAVNHGAGSREVVSFSWIPSLGLNLTFLVDGLSLLFGLIVSGMGTLVFYYSTQYLDDQIEHHGRFYAYLALFMGAMLGTVFAGNLLLLFVFWELTGIASFLLIGFFHRSEESRSGARMALLVTGSTGLAMLAGVALIGTGTGTYDLAVLLAAPLDGMAKESVNLAFVLFAVGAFGKSAQFPFHFWLPNAMAAPTPVSAYLHSATMVKLGVFLIARIFPIFRDSDLWGPLLISVCFGTMLLGAILALLSHDLKAILAYSTVSQLGFLIGFYGMSPREGAEGDFLHILSHVFYKGCLFMVVGIIDHSTGIRDLRRLGGLRTHLPWLTVVAVIAAASMAGVPGTLGFISKEYMLKAKFDFWGDGGFASWYPLAVVTAASVIKVAFSYRIIAGVFFGRAPEGISEHFHAPSFRLQFAPTVLAGACLIFGLFPELLGGWLRALSTPGLHPNVGLTFSLWHGLTKELLLSVFIVLAGLGLQMLLRGARGNDLRIPRWLRFDQIFSLAVEGLPSAAKRVSRWLRADRPFDYLPIVFGTFVVVIGGYCVAHAGLLLPAWPQAADFDPLRTFVVGLIAAATVLVVALRQWSGQLIALSIVGFLITFYYVLFRAPDLAMTQILVESATLLLALLLLARFPKSAELSERRDLRPTAARRGLVLFLSIGTGAVMTIVTLMALGPKHAAPAGAYYLEATVPLAHGTNTVNTILVDFRGFDTLLEITVLLVATLGGIGLMMRYRRTAEEYAAGAHGPAGYGIGASPGETETDGKKGHHEVD